MIIVHDVNAERLRYTNQRGETYHLRHLKLASGCRYVMSKNSTDALESLPAGYEIRENANGQVSIGRIRSNRVADLELELVRAAIDRLPAQCYRALAKGPTITVYASAQDGECFANTLDAEFADGFASAMEEIISRKYGHELAELFRAKRQQRDGKKNPCRYYPLLRFHLVDKSKRAFRVQRIYFSGDQDWLTLETLSLSAAVMKYIPHLGRNSFFDLL